MNPLRVYEYLCRARKRVFDWVRPLSEEQYSRSFPIGLGSIGRTLTHVAICEWMYVRRIEGSDVPAYEQFPFQDEQPPPFLVLEEFWNQQADRTRLVLNAIRDWNATLEYNVERDGKRTLVTASPGDIFTQIALHEVHHRAQAMNMLRQLGIAAEDIDYNALMYQRRELPD
jgi:uncharacterized damage-inducible protein DinB